METHLPQEFLDRLQQINLAVLFETGRTELRVPHVGHARDPLSDLRQQLEAEMGRVSANWDGQNLHTRARRQQALAPYAEVQRLIVSLETALSALKVNGITYEKPTIGTQLVFNQRTGLWQILSFSDALQEQTQTLWQQLASSHQLKEILQRDLEALPAQIEVEQQAAIHRTVIAVGLMMLLVPIAFVIMLLHEYPLTVLLIGMSALGSFAAIVQLEHENWRRDVQRVIQAQNLQTRLAIQEKTTTRYEDQLKSRQPTHKGAGSAWGVMPEQPLNQSTAIQKRAGPHS